MHGNILRKYSEISNGIKDLIKVHQIFKIMDYYQKKLYLCTANSVILTD